MKKENSKLDMLNFHTLVERTMEALGYETNNRTLKYSVGLMLANVIKEASYVKNGHSKLGDAIGLDVSDRIENSYHLNMLPVNIMHFMFDDSEKSTIEYNIVCLAEQWIDDICDVVYKEAYTKCLHSLTGGSGALWNIMKAFLFSTLTENDKKVLYAMCYDIKSLDC